MISRYAHDSYPLNVTIEDDSGAPVPLGGVVVSARVVGSNITELTGAVVDSTRGEAQIEFPDAMDPGEYKLTIKMTDAAGAVHVVYVGDLRILEDYLE